MQKINIFNYLLLTAVFMLVCGLCKIASAESGYPTDEELKLLPPYCKARLRSVSEAESNRWRQILGPENWISIHHYCQDLNIINKARFEMDPKLKKRSLISAYGSLTRYAAQQITPNFVLRYEVYYNIGIVALDIDKPGEGVTALMKSIRLKPEFTLSYAALSDYYRDSGNKGEAIKILEDGLKYTPKSKSLNRRIKELQQ